MRSATDAVKWPSSCTKTSRPRPTIATKIVMPAASPLPSRAPRLGRPPRRDRRGRAPERRRCGRARRRPCRRSRVKPMRAVEEGRHGDLVGGVVRAREGAAALAGLAGERQQRERLLVDRLEPELDAPPRGRAAAAGHGLPLGIGEREGDRHAHVRAAEMREQRAVAEAHERVHDRARVDDDLDGRSYGMPKSQCASISSSPLFASVAESTVIFRPIDQVGCASASSTVTCSSSARVRPRNGPPDAVRTSDSTVSGSRPSRHWKSAECSLSTGSRRPPPRAVRRDARAHPPRRGSPCSRERA